jgi:hypothetical protein
MSGTVTSNVFKASGVIAATPGGLDWSSAVITGSTLSAETGRGYFINTTSNACTVTLPASPAIGDQIVFADYARTWATNNVIIDSNGNNFQGESDAYTVDYSTAGQSLNIVYSDATKGWLPVSDDAVADVPVAPATQRAIFAFGTTGSVTNISSLVNSSGVVGSDVSGVGTARQAVAAVSYGGDKAIYSYGSSADSNLVSNQGVVASDVTAVGTNGSRRVGCPYGGDKGIFSYTNSTNETNLVSNQGVIASSVTGVGTNRDAMGGAGFGSANSRGIWAYGQGGYNISNLISTTGVVSSNVAGVGTARYNLCGTMFGGDQGIFGYGYLWTTVTNKVSNTGVVASDTSGAGTNAYDKGAAPYGGDKGIFGFGQLEGVGLSSITNLISNTGVTAANTTGVGVARKELAGAGYSFSA